MLVMNLIGPARNEQIRLSKS